MILGLGLGGGFRFGSGLGSGLRIRVRLRLWKCVESQLVVIVIGGVMCWLPTAHSTGGNLT